MSLSPFFIQQQEARLETYEKLSQEWEKRGYDVRGKVTVLLENQKQHFDSLDRQGSPQVFTQEERSSIYRDIVETFSSDDPRWEPAMSVIDVIYTPAGQRKSIDLQLFQMFRTNTFEIVGRAPLIEPPSYTFQSFVQNLFRNCEGRLLGVLTPVSAVIDYPALYRKGEVAMVAGVWV